MELIKGIHYNEGVWGEWPRYDCTLCPFDTLALSALAEHFAQIHAPAPGPQENPPVEVELYDAFGNRITDV